MLNILRFGIALLVIGLFGCGGGGGGGDGGAAPSGGGGGGGGGLTQPSSAPAAITSTNSQKAAEVAIEPALSGVSLLSTATAVQTTSTSQPRLTQVLRAAVNPTRQLAAGQSVVGVVQTIACSVSGSVTIDAADNGLSFSMTFNACSDASGQSINGSLTASGVSAASDGSSLSATFTIDLTYTQSGQPTLRTVGSFSISETCTPGTFNCTTTFSGSSLGSQEGAEIWFLSNFSITETVTSSSTSTSVTYTVSSSILGGSLTVSTVSPVVTLTGAAHPQSGQILVTGLGSRVRVTVNSSSTMATNAVTVSLDANNDGTFESNTNYSWAQLEAA